MTPYPAETRAFAINRARTETSDAITNQQNTLCAGPTGSPSKNTSNGFTSRAISPIRSLQGRRHGTIHHANDGSRPPATDISSTLDEDETWTPSARAHPGGGLSPARSSRDIQQVYTSHDLEGRDDRFVASPAAGLSVTMRSFRTGFLRQRRFRPWLSQEHRRRGGPVRSLLLDGQLANDITVDITKNPKVEYFILTPIMRDAWP